MSGKKITKKDPRREISGWLDYQAKAPKTKDQKMSASLPKLRKERRHALFAHLGVIVLFSSVAILALGYYVSPKANVATVEFVGAPELNRAKLVQAAQIKPSDKMVSLFFNQRKLTHKLADQYPEVRSISLSIKKTNHLVIKLSERNVIGYISQDGYCRKILDNGEIGTQKLSSSTLDTSKPLFVGYNQKTACKKDIAIFTSFPTEIRQQVKMMSGATQRATQIILVMKDGNVIIGNTATINQKIKYYSRIKRNLTTSSVIDLEVGAYSHPLSSEEKSRYGLAK